MIVSKPLLVEVFLTYRLNGLSYSNNLKTKMIELTTEGKVADVLQFKSISEKSIILPLLSAEPKLFSYLHPALANDQEVVKVALEKDGTLYLLLDKQLKYDRSLALIATKQCGLVLNELPEFFLEQEEFIIAALTSRGDSFKYLPEQYNCVPRFMLLAATIIKNQCIATLPPSLKSQEHSYVQKDLHHYLVKYFDESVQNSIGNSDIYSYLENWVLYEKLQTVSTTKDTNKNKNKL